MKEFVALKPKMYQFSVDDSSEHKKAEGANKNVVAKIQAIMNTRLLCRIKNV